MVGKREKNTANCEMGWKKLGYSWWESNLPDVALYRLATEQLPLDDGMELKYWNRQWHSKYEFVYRAGLNNAGVV
jgi:hypothetical protein